MELISVIVPVYKVEPYLDKCVRSIVDQTYQNLEIILVDDGSPDRCGVMCDAWAAKDSRIKVIHKKNGGLSDARNAGLAVATGEYIAFVDSDDWVDPNYLHHLHRAIRDTGAGISACGIRITAENEQVPPVPACDVSPEVCSAEEAIGGILRGEGFRAVAWNKLYHRTYLEGESYPVGKYHEDEFFTYRILAKADRLAYVELPLYCYLQRAGSIMHTLSMKHLDALDAHLERLTFLKDRFPGLYPRDKVTFCLSCAAFYRQGLRADLPDRQAFLKKIRAARRQVTFSAPELKMLSRKELLYVLGTAAAPGLFCRLLNFKNKEAL